MEANVCFFCDGSVHDNPAWAAPRPRRAELVNRGYCFIVIRYDQPMIDQIRRYPDVFGIRSSPSRP